MSKKCDGRHFTYSETENMSESMSRVSEFNGKAFDYDLYRPEYPDDISQIIEERVNLKFEGLDVAELGCGTGKFTKILSPEVRSLFAIDNNKEMLRHVEEAFANDRKVMAVLAEAENSNLNASTIDLVLSAQAFHHFDVTKVITEINRILKPNGKVFLVWYFSNMHQDLSKEIRTCFYKYGNHLKQKKRLEISPKAISIYFTDRNISFHHLGELLQTHDYESFVGSMRSSSYAPNTDDPLFDRYLGEIDSLFFKWESAGFVTLQFDLHSYLIEKKEHKIEKN